MTRSWVLCLKDRLKVSASVGYFSTFASVVDNDRDLCVLGSNCQLLSLDLLVSRNHGVNLLV